MKHPMPFSVTPARPPQAEAIAETLRRSIGELCAADHHGDPQALARWLANKTATTVLHWLDDADLLTLVAAVDTGAIAGVAQVRAQGEITLNYVSPDHRYSGVSRALMRALEDHLRDIGLTAARLTSTATARRFYLAQGYEANGPPRPWHGGSLVHPMVKLLG